MEQKGATEDPQLTANFQETINNNLSMCHAFGTLLGISPTLDYLLFLRNTNLTECTVFYLGSLSVMHLYKTKSKQTKFWFYGLSPVYLFVWVVGF